MAKTIKEERLRWVLPVIKKELQLLDVAKVCPHGKRSLERWVAAYKRSGEAALEPKSTEPKTQPEETPIWIKERVIGVRKKTGKCALKIHWQMEKEGILIHPRTIGKILKKEGLVRKYRVKRIKYKYIKAERKPGELVEIDIKYVPGTIEGKEYFQYTAIWKCLRDNRATTQSGSWRLSWKDLSTTYGPSKPTTTPLSPTSIPAPIKEAI